MIEMSCDLEERLPLTKTSYRNKNVGIGEERDRKTRMFYTPPIEGHKQLLQCCSIKKKALISQGQ